MNALTYDRRDEGWGAQDDDDSRGDRMPGRPRRRYATRASGALAAVVLLGLGFYAGVRVEKSQVGSSSGSTASTLASAFAARARTAAAGAGATGGGAGRAGAGAGLPFGGGGGGGAPSLGTVSSLSGRTLFLSDVSGNTVKVKLASSTKISKSLPVPRRSIHPGDSVVIQGIKNSSGTLIAASVSDSGTSGRSTSGSSSSSSSSSGGSSSGVGSLFTPGGGG
jgi:hypothetical protein